MKLEDKILIEFDEDTGNFHISVFCELLGRSFCEVAQCCEKEEAERVKETLLIWAREAT